MEAQYNHSINNQTALKLKCLITLLFCAFSIIPNYNEYTTPLSFVDEDVSVIKSSSYTTRRSTSTTSIIPSPACKLFPSVIAGRYNSNNHNHNHNNTINYRGNDNENENSNNNNGKSSSSSSLPLPLSIQDQNYTRLVFLHMRKAGGTTIRHFLQNVVKSNNTSFQEFVHCEGHKKCLEFPNNENNDDGYHRYNMETNTSRNKKTLSRDTSGRTLYVTNLREPISRIVSNYRYDQRWDCDNKLLKMNTNTNTNTNENNTNSSNAAAKREYFIPTLENQDMSLEEFGLEQFPSFHKKSKNKNRKLWRCSTNCYSRWVTGMYYPTTDTDHPSSLLQKKQQQRQKKQKQKQKHQTQTQIQQKLTKYRQILSEESKKLLLQYDLIIVLEWLKYPEYVEAVENYFGGGSGSDDLFTGLLSKPPRPIYCSKSSKLANKLVPLDTEKLLLSPVVSSSSYNNDDNDSNDSNDSNDNVTLLQVLEKRNEIDISIYNTLTSC
ncbi:hypothetical protein FRACYDRAFT_264647 [Fragilariopsis cylindrus CCMP1102]|uniref:Sulfotransferase domain-containing protein n=1 Tax=Fragilariopsis cylindrus CCMP1102 TaxID=635003 RepID=A0A1E7EQV1_9STRA|nr:hypothetical protein FRACYDRAFT_264647 [Fragilariopsis cylindrus CCMP1102]|eukprot:OEU08186.1 hypothetical protein FRACYDRAFT_264647 [Fragilariopsis cylindrus CCMP1102]